MKEFTIIAGPNGSGKTTLTNLLRRKFDFGNYINPDEYSVGLRKKNPTLEQYLADSLAQKQAKKDRDACLKGDKSFAYETVLSHHSHLDFMAEARRNGFHVNLYFVSTLDPAINVERVAMRVENGGHSVPTEKIIRRYKRTHELLPIAMQLANQGQIWDNSDTPSMIHCLGQKETTKQWIGNKSQINPNWFKKAYDSYIAFNQGQNVKIDKIQDYIKKQYAG